MRITSPALFWFPFAWSISFHRLTFSLYVSLGLEWVSLDSIYMGLVFVSIQPICVFSLECLINSLLLFSHVWLFATPCTVACQASLSLTISWSLLKFMFIALVMLSSHLILWCPLLLLPSVFPSIRDFSNESAVHIRWPKYQSYSFSISPSSKYPGLISLKIDWFDLLSKGLSGVFSSTTVRRHQFFGVLHSLWSSSHNHMWPLGRP